jgi:ABC-2 type transport system permease protein
MVFRDSVRRSPMDDPAAADSGAVARVGVAEVLGVPLLPQSRVVGAGNRLRAGLARLHRVTAPPPARFIEAALGRIAVAMFQAAYLVVATALLFGASWGDPLASAVTVTMFAMVAGGAGMLVGTLARNESQASGLGIGLGIGLGALGGSMVPLEVMPDTLARVARLTPHAWANSAFAEIVRRGGGVGDVLIELAVLAAFAVMMLGLAVAVLRRRLAHG